MESFMNVSKPTPERVHIKKTRQCLKCRDKFMSSWPGERICKRCKTIMEHTGTGIDSARFVER